MAKEREFLIQASGFVREPKNTAFVVKATSPELAEKQAVREFCCRFPSADEVVYVETHTRRMREMIAIVCMTVAIALSLINWKYNHETISIRPDLLSTGFSVVFYCIFIARFKGVKNIITSVLDVVQMILFVFLIASLLQGVLIKKEISLFRLVDFTIDTRLLLIIALILMAFGLKLISLICFGAIAVFGFVNIGMLSTSMRFWGAIYTVAAFVGIVAYMSTEPAVIGALSEYKKMAYRLSARAGKDIGDAKASAGRIGASIKGSVQQISLKRDAEKTGDDHE